VDRAYRTPPEEYLLKGALKLLVLGGCLLKGNSGYGGDGSEMNPSL
jgi:hypothetical protein